MISNEDGTYSDPNLPNARFMRLPSGVFINMLSRQPIIWDLSVVSAFTALVCFGQTLFPRESFGNYLAAVGCLWICARLGMTFDHKTVIHPQIKVLIIVWMFIAAGLFFSYANLEAGLRQSAAPITLVCCVLALMIGACRPKELEKHFVDR